MTSELYGLVANQFIHNQIELGLRSMFRSRLVRGFGHYHMRDSTLMPSQGVSQG